MFNELNDFLLGNESLLDLEDDDIIDGALEAEIFLAALREECENEEEYDRIATECATELELYGLIHSAEIVTEARKNIVKLNKEANYSKIEKRTAIRLAEKDNSSLYKAYIKGRKLMIAARIKIYERYLSKARPIAKKIIANSRRKASAMKSAGGATITQKMDAVIAKTKKD